MDVAPIAAKCKHLRTLRSHGKQARTAATTARAQASPVHAVALDASGRFALLCADKQFSLWNWERVTLIHSYPSAYDVVDVATSGDSERAVASAGKAALVWDVATATVTRKFGRHEGAVNGAVFFGDDIVVTACYDTHVRLFDARQAAGKAIQVLGGAKDSVSCVLAVDGEQIVAASVDGCLRAYDVRKGALQVDSLASPITSACVTNDGQCVLVSCLDDRLRLVLRETGEVLNVYEGHKSRQFQMGCCVLYDDSAVVCGSEESGSFICVWPVEGTCAEKFDVTPGGQPVCAFASHPSKPVVLIGSLDGSASVHEVRL